MAIIKQAVTEKIAVLGLNNAGKTSILKVISQEFSNLSNLFPTQGVERFPFEYLGRNLVFWDFGGQEKYKIKYLANPERHFENIELFFYVVDIQDENLINDSITYYMELVEHILLYSPDSKFVILFHKFDPELKDRIKSLNLKKKFKDSVSDILEPIITKEKKKKHPYPIYQFETSILNPKSIIDAFSKPFLDNIDFHELISNFLGKFVKKHGLAFANLTTTSYFDLGNATAEWIEDEQIDELYTMLMNSIIPKSNVYMEVTLLEPDYPYKFICSGFSLSLNESSVPFILIISYTNKSESKEDIIKKELIGLQESLKKVLINSDLSKINRESV